jgi:cell division protein FtsB
MSEKSPYEGKSRIAEQLRRRQRPLLSLPQILVLAGIVFAVFVGFDLNRRAQEGAQIEQSEEAMESKLNLELTRQVELVMTRDYVNSDAYIAAYARNEAGLILPGERRVVPLLIETTPIATPIPTATPDPAYDARPWQAWWRLLSDAPLPSR